ncbi:PTS fructose transporter subunit IIA [Kitasatospora sp. NBC_01250]|uniref:PTS-dependent dihydroxyacetone kinase phosphotransferase subunit DhaM n=1 Tax=unclassified Kitasatospora TaxID=2633591 RepID=UPI002E127C28|nr:MULTISPECIES: PTS fructose transporter subunit IIA [unclassified Kitasatospora]WSJ70523.1 PTS fructose transporter subunit IIA [Kitasatospora sp. NBC_01302]
MGQISPRGGNGADVIPIGEAPSAARVPSQAPLRSAALGRVGVVLVSHSGELAQDTADLARAMSGTDDPAPVAATGGQPGDGLGSSALLIAAAARRVDQGHGVAVLADLPSAVQTVAAVLAAADEHGLPFPVRFADAPFVEGAVVAVLTASAGGDLAAVVEAAEETYRQRKL